ncbi:SusC/RagA family TonB-linked outer membrane protein [Pontibacter beigongshangensis]|uniref:SusC/RagA family TonB-linked outer membrane protein n=1 Tax=Pontibacter beigongshangensis TaxID=2574733 RepID=UPI00164FEC69|nr:SusC/RagA family TonB-linked outer membrane protein [Pontibacter beigongshangensis]
MHTYIKKFGGLAICFGLSVYAPAALAQQADSVAVRVVQQEGQTISGVVRHANTGAPLPGISISVPGFSSAFTDDNGAFTIKVPSDKATLTISGDGIQQKQVPVKGRSNLLVAVSEASANSIYNQAYLPNNQQSLNTTTNSVVTVGMPNKWGRSFETPDSYLQGQIAGVNVVRRSGTSGIGANMFLRGFSSLNGTNQPLVIVDGMIYDMNDDSNSLINGFYTNPLAHIDIKDIENITFIKDAVSTYGSKAANGVMLITTAYAKDLATRIDFSAFGGANFRPSALPVLQADDYRLYLADVLKTGGLSDSDIQALPFMNDDATRPGYYSYHNNTNWQDQVLRNGINNNYNLRVTGGDNIAKYALSVGYMNQKGIVDESNYDRYTTRFNGDYQISPKLTASSRLAFTYSENKVQQEGLEHKTNPLYLGLVKSPLVNTNVISDEGVRSPNLTDVDVFNISNPRALIENSNFLNNNYRFFGSVSAGYAFKPNLNLSTMIGITYDKVRESTFIPRKGVLADTLSNAVVYSRMGSQLQRLFSLYNDTKLSYGKEFNNIHGFKSNLGVRYSYNLREHDFGLGYNSATDELQTIGMGVNALRRTGGGIGRWNWLNYYANVDYQVLNKYFLNVNVGIDGSSRFGKEIDGALSMFGYKFGVFPSVGAGWLISSENFMANIEAIEVLKVRASYGLTGNDDIGNYSSRQLYVSQNLLGMQGVVRGNIANPALQWETNRKMNVGFDLALKNERVGLSVDVYQTKTDNMLTYQPVAKITGFEYMLANSGAMENKGVEVALNSQLLTGALKWQVGLTYAANQNRITALPTDNMTTNFAGATILTRIGEPVGLFYGYKTNGVYATDAQADADGFRTKLPDGSLVPFRGGDIRFTDVNGDKEINDNDRVIIGNSNPDFFGMFSNRLEFKRFSLDALVTFSVGNDIYNYTRAQLESMKGAENQSENVLNRWRTEGQQTDVPRANWGDPLGNHRFSDRWIEDGSYLRLRTLTIAYQVPVKTKIIKYANIYMTGNNLLTLTKYLGYDPEFSGSSDVRLQGIDTGLVPQSRSLLAGVRFGL